MANSNNTFTINAGPLLFQFETFQRWVDHAQSWFRTCGVPSAKTICIDSKGRICASGKEFMRARDDDSFPVSVFAIEPEVEPLPEIIEKVRQAVIDRIMVCNRVPVSDIAKAAELDNSLTLAALHLIEDKEKSPALFRLGADIYCSTYETVLIRSLDTWDFPIAVDCPCLVNFTKFPVFAPAARLSRDPANGYPSSCHSTKTLS